MDAEHLDFPDQTFDAVTCALSLFLCPDMEAALREMYRVAKPGGSIGISMFAKTPPPFNPGWPILIQQFDAYEGWVRVPQPLAYAPEEVEDLLSHPVSGPSGYGVSRTTSSMRALKIGGRFS